MQQQKANLDILRTFAVSTVLLQHLALTVNITHPLPANLMDFLNPIGHAGVLAFFVHTSLVLMYSLGRLRATLPVTAWGITWRFYVRRIFRIYPLAVASIALVLALHLPPSTWKPAAAPLTHHVIVANLLLVQNFVGKADVLGPLWSLPYEIDMYVVLPALFLVSMRKRSYVALGLLLTASCVGGLVFHWRTGHLNLAAYVPCFLAGVLCYALRHRQSARVPAMLWNVFLIAMICGFCALNMHRAEPGFVSGWFFCLVLGLSINLFHDSRGRSWNRAAETVALYSYGVYLLHMPVLYLVFLHWRIASPTLASALSLVGTGVAAFAAYHVLEAPAIALGRRLSSPAGKLQAVRPAEVMPAP